MQGFIAAYADGNILTENEDKVNNPRELTFIIDPGHGGVDGGAVGISGTLEKDINLRMSFLISDLLYVMGYDVKMTRREDVLLGEGEKGRVKLEDLKARVDFAKGCEGAVFISIHMNKFPEEGPHGLTVYYSPNHPESERLGGLIKDANIRYLQPDNKRPMKKATTELYVLHRVQVPAVLIECGFLSNSSEEKALSDENYRKRLAMTIVSGIIEYAESQ